jgi:hypothetical protein
MLLLELQVPPYVYKKILEKTKKYYNDVVKDVVKSKKTRTARIFIENTPRGWWVALTLLREGPGTIYILKSVSIIDIPSKILELSRENWNNEFEKIIREELKKWGLER